VRTEPEQRFEGQEQGSIFASAVQQAWQLRQSLGFGAGRVRTEPEQRFEGQEQGSNVASTFQQTCQPRESQGLELAACAEPEQQFEGPRALCVQGSMFASAVLQAWQPW